MCRTEVGETASILGPEGFERKAECPAENRGATNRGFCEQRERGKDFERAAGDGDSNAVPFPRPLLMLEDARTLLQSGNCVQKICAILGVYPKLVSPRWVQHRVFEDYW